MIDRRTNWYFADLNDVDKQVWLIGQTYKAKVLAQADDRRRARAAIPILKAYYLYYLSGCRNQELFMHPFTIAYERKTVSFTHVNEKHFVDKERKARSTVEATMPINGLYERKMLWYITSGFEEFEIDRILRLESWRSIKHPAIAEMFKTNFKTTLRVPEETNPRKDEGITPHILRHMRVYNVLVDKKLWRDPIMASKWFGWNSAEMLYYYAEIKRILEHERQTQRLEELGLLEQNWDDPALTLS